MVLDLGSQKNWDVDLMITWTQKIGDDMIRLVGFDKHMRELVNMVQTESRWTIELDGRIIQVEGNQCNDPLRFIECLVSPNLVAQDTTQSGLVLEFIHGDGEAWEVWNGGI